MSLDQVTVRKVNKVFDDNFVIFQRTLSYLKCTGKQGINTGYSPDATKKVKIEITFSNLSREDITDVTYLYGGYDTQNSAAAGSYTYQSFGNPSISLGNSTYYGSTITFPNTDEHTYQLIIDDGSAELILDDVSQGTVNFSGSINTPIGIGCGIVDGEATGFTTAKIHRFKIYEDDVLIKDFVQCIYNCKPSFMEVISNNIYPSITDDDFVYP